MKRIFLLFFFICQCVLCIAQNPSSDSDDDYKKALEAFSMKDYNKTLIYLQLCKLSQKSSQEDIVLLEIRSLYHLKKYEECLTLIDQKIAAVSFSMDSLTIISGIKLKIIDIKKKKRIEVEKLKIADKVQNEPSAWGSFLDHARSSIKSMISN